MTKAGISQEEIAALFAQRENGQSDQTPRAAAFPSLESAAAAASAPSSIGILANVEMEVTVQLGQTRRNIREILSYGPGSVLELDRLAGESVDILVNGRLVAKGEVVVIGENFGVRVTDLVPLEGGNPR